MPLPALCSCKSSPIKIQADLGPQHSRNLYGSTYFWALFWRHKLRLFCAMLLLLLLLILDCTKTHGIITEAQLNNLSPTKFKSNPSRSSENVSTLAWDPFFPSWFELICSSIFGPGLEAKIFKSSRQYFYSIQFWPFKALTLSEIWGTVGFSGGDTYIFQVFNFHGSCPSSLRMWEWVYHDPCWD